MALACQRVLKTFPKKLHDQAKYIMVYATLQSYFLATLQHNILSFGTL